MLPVIDSRDKNELIKKMKEMVPYYTPEWKFNVENPDPGTALFLIFAEMFQETIKRFNKVPVKNYIAFLNMIDTSVLPAKPAKAYITFCLSEGAKESVLIPAGTKVSSTSDDAIFETVENMLATPSAPVDAYNVSGKYNRIYKIPTEFFSEPNGEEQLEITMFDLPEEDNRQKHCLYLGHSNLLNIEKTALIELELQNPYNRNKVASMCAKLANIQNTKWMYWGEDDWHDFDEVSTNGNKIILKKTTLTPIANKALQGVESRWIRCEVESTKINEVSDIEIEDILINTAFYNEEKPEGLEPDMAFRNDIQLNIKAFYPFGEYFALYDMFYISSHEIFSKMGATITMRFKLNNVRNKLKSDVERVIDWKLIMKESELEEPKPPEIYVLKVIWEYWNGNGWVKLLSQKEYEEIFCCNLDSEQSIVFQCPYDIKEMFVNSQYNYWIRARIVNVQNVYSIDTIYCAPQIKNITLKYEYVGVKFSVEQCMAYNNLEFQGLPENIIDEDNLFTPFCPVECKYPAFYIGFEIPPLRGPISMLFSVKPQEHREEVVSAYEWEYLGGSSNAEWLTLKTIDTTSSFMQSGTVVFSGPLNFKKKSIFGRELYWVRIINSDGKLEGDKALPAPIIKGIYINSTLAIQHSSIKNEMPGSIQGEKAKEYTLSVQPVISEEVWVNEVEQITEDEKIQLREDKWVAIQEKKDEMGNTDEFWVRWSPVVDFLQSKPEDRHYVIDRILGKFYFGDGICGKLPPSSGEYSIRVSYKVGGGAKGNVGAYEISGLQNSIAFVDTVQNLEPSSGGTDTETIEEALKRGPHIIKHRDRAVTAEDFEWLARQASQNIARVKCLPHTNEKGEQETGCVSLVILTKEEGRSSTLFPAVKAQVEKYLLDRTANIVALPNKIYIIEPVRLEISIDATIITKKMDNVLTIEREAIYKLNEFLHPLRGNFDSKGWEIGKYPHISAFYTLLKAVGGVHSIEKVSMSVCEIIDGMRIERESASFEKLQHGMIVNGKHSISITVK